MTTMPARLGVRVTRRDLIVVGGAVPVLVVLGVAVSALSADFGPAKVLWALAVLVGGALALADLRVALAILVLALAFPLRSKLLLGIEVHTTHFLLAAVALLGLVQLATGRLRVPAGLAAPALAIVAGAVLASVAGPDPAGSLFRTAFSLALPLLVALVAAAVLQPQRDLPLLVTALSGGVAGASLIAIAQTAGVAPESLFPMWEADRAVGLFLHPNILGGFLAAGVVVLVGMASFAWRAFPLAGPLFVPSILLGVAGLAATQSRAGLAALAAGTFVLLIIMAARRQAAPVLALLAVVALVLTVAVPRVPESERVQYAERFEQLMRPGAESGRRSVYEQAWQVIRANPLTGVGPMTFRDMIERRATVPGLERGLGHAHNVLLEGWLSLGLLGLAGLAWLWVGGTARLVRALRRTRDPVVAGWAAGTVAALVTFLVQGMVDVVFWQVEMLLLLFLLLASGHALTQRPQTEPADGR